MAEIIFTGDLMCSPSITEKTNKKYDILLEKMRSFFAMPILRSETLRRRLLGRS